MDRDAVRVMTMREIRQRLRDRGYLLTTLALVGGLTVLAMAVALGESSTDRYAVGSLDRASARVVAAAGERAPLFGVELAGRVVPDAATAERLLATGELDAGVLGVRRTPLDLRDVVAEAVGGLELLLDKKRQMLEVDLPTPWRWRGMRGDWSRSSPIS